MRMSLLRFLFVVVLAGVFSCNKDDDDSCPYTDPNVTVPAAEVQAVQAYLTSKGITNATQDPRGFFYVITTPGTGAVAGPCNRITINYVGKLTNDTIFDQTPAGSPRNFVLGQLIPGWIKGIPLIKPGGKISLYLPPTLGYGPVQNGPIPANSVLIFDIDLLNVQ
jgi:FKBP-type peptidyl-prolyl cis-trans isomerase FkpA